ncbi:MCP four helix bundle domain-containing protein [Halocola ammonii]
MSIANKIRWVASILLILLIVLLTNLIDQDNFSKLRNSVTTIYEDRIVANDLIFEMSTAVQKKEIAVATKDSAFFSTQNGVVNRQIENHIERYEQTKLTEEERETFNDLKEELQNLKKLEEQFTASEAFEAEKMRRSIDEITSHLSDLSKIQLHEGRKQMAISNKAMNTIDLFTQGEIIFLIIVAILVQIIILYKPRKTQES